MEGQIFLQKFVSKCRNVARPNVIVNYQPFWAARGHLLRLLNRNQEAQEAFTRAASLTDDPALREYLFKRATGGLV